MSKPPINPDKTVAGIALDPQTLERVIPESRRPDGTVRKQIKIRPGYTPQEDVKRFRGTKQAQLDANALPKGHIIGWAPPPTSSANSGSGTKPMSKSAKKNAKRKEKKAEKEQVPDSWEDDDDEASPPSAEPSSTGTLTPSKKDGKSLDSTEPANSNANKAAVDLAKTMEKLDVK